MSETPDSEDAAERKPAPVVPTDDVGAPSNGARTSPADRARAEAESKEESGGEDDAGDDGDEDFSDGTEALLPEGNPLHLVRGWAIAGAGALLTFVVMAITRQFRMSVPLGALGVLVTTFGLLDLLGTFDDPDARVAGRATLRELAVPLGLFFGGGLALVGLVTLAVAGFLPVAASALTVTPAFLAMVVGVYGTGERLGVWEARSDGTPRRLLERHGFWLVVLTALMYLPMLGSHSLSDPWETHYGEVSREILSRNDWISLWWAQEGWFWSKPVLDFWMQALAMAAFGVRFMPGRMLSAAAEGRDPWPEWAVRLPVFFLVLFAVYLLYKAIAKTHGRRAGLFGGIALLTMPQWFFLAHQTMTDMPFVATMAATMALFLLGIFTDPERLVKAYEIDFGRFRLRLSAYHLVIGAILACTVPQILYLLSRNVSITALPFSIHAHPDIFTSGSPENCLLPGNEPCKDGLLPVVRGLQPAVQALIWTQAVALLLYLNWGERRLQRLLFLAAWLFAGLSTLGKGIAGFALPALCALAFVGATKRWRDLTRMEIASGFVILLAVALPWFVAMYARHGQPFTDRLLFHDMYKRAVTHVHDTNEGDDVSFRFYVWQLGYATFPWTGLLPAALVWWLRKGDGDPRVASGGARATSAHQASVLMALWFLFSFTLFSLMLTKFHHYVFPAIPPAAMLVGVLLDDFTRRSGKAEERWTVPGLLTVSGATLALVAALSLALTRSGVTEAGPVGDALVAVRRADVRLAGLGAALGVLMIIGAAVLRARTEPTRDEDRDPDASESGGDGDDAFVRSYERVMLGAAALAGALLLVFVGLDMAQNREGLPSQIRLMHLFTYNYKRPWPTSLDFGGALFAFTIAAAVLLVALAVARWRRHVVVALATLAVLFGVWGLDIYLVRTSPHWGQRETMVAYYRAAKDIPGPMVAYQMNWKGENFYMGNEVPAFVSSGKKFQDWIAGERGKGQKTFYFMTEHGRTGTLSNELGQPPIFEKLTTPALNNKFVLMRATFN